MMKRINHLTAEQLRKSILQLAIQGKLVSQNVEDGNAEDLLAEIKNEKAKLIKEGKIKKEKPLPEITDREKPFEIPESWVWVRLRNICEVKGGKRIPSGCTYSSAKTNYRYLRVADMKNNTIIGCAYVDDKIYNLINNYTINKGDIYITVAGTIGEVGIIPDEYDGANLTENADKLLLNDRINKMFILKCLTSNFCQESIKDVTTKVGQPKLAIKRIEDLLIPIPPIAEQKRIVAKIEQIFDELGGVEKAVE